MLWYSCLERRNGIGSRRDSTALCTWLTNTASPSIGWRQVPPLAHESLEQLLIEPTISDRLPSSFLLSRSSFEYARLWYFTTASCLQRACAITAFRQSCTSPPSRSTVSYVEFHEPVHEASKSAYPADQVLFKKAHITSTACHQTTTNTSPRPSDLLDSTRLMSGNELNMKSFVLVSLHSWPKAQTTYINETANAIRLGS